MAKMEIGVFIRFESILAPDELATSLRKAEEMGFAHVQMWTPRVDLFHKDNPKRAMIIDVARKTKLEITSMFAAFHGSKEFWDAELPNPRLRKERTSGMMEIADLANEMKIKTITSHIGSIPSDRDDENYKETVKAIRKIADHCAENGQQLRLETGMESAACLRQFIIDANRDNIKVNLDLANLIGGGYEGSVEALDQLGEFVAEVHLKDSKRPALGVEAVETPLGQGSVDFEALIRKLDKIGFRGILTIEREITGEDWGKDVLNGRDYIEGIKQRLGI